MYCRNCSHVISSGAIACSQCGVPPLVGNKFCFNCAAETDEKAIICVHCGVGFQKPSTSFNSTVIIDLWRAFPYSTYIIILLFSLLPFFNIKCGGNKIENVTGLDMAIGAERKFDDSETYRDDYGNKHERYVTNTESLFSWDIALFYGSVLICIYYLFGSRSNKFNAALGWTIVGLILLVEWAIVVSIRKSKYETALIEVSLGIGYWLSLLTIIICLILLNRNSGQSQITNSS